LVGYTKAVKTLLVEAGCEFVRYGKGDHEIWRAPGGQHFTVDANIKSRHTANATLKQAGFTKKF
jgi:hypothetical protein